MTEFELDFSDMDMYVLFPPEEYPITTQQAFQHALADVLNEEYDNMKETRVGAMGVLQSRKDAVTISIDQDASDLNWDAIQRYDLDVGRRLSIGFGHYHHKDQLVYAMIFSDAYISENFSSPGEIFEALKEPIQEALSRMGIEARLPEPEDTADAIDPEITCLAGSVNILSDLVVDNRKISTSVAHYELDNFIGFHGTIEYKRRPERLIEIFNMDAEPEDLEAHITSIDEHTDITRDEAQEILEETLLDWAQTTENTGEIRDRMIQRAEELNAEKYSQDDWLENNSVPSGMKEFKELLQEE